MRFLPHKFGLDPVTFIYVLDLYSAPAPAGEGMGHAPASHGKFWPPHQDRLSYTAINDGGTVHTNKQTNKRNSVPWTSIIGSLSSAFHVSRLPIPLFLPPAVATWRWHCLYPLKVYPQNKSNLSLSRLLKVSTLQTDKTKTITTLWVVLMQAANICDTMTNRCRDHSIIKTQTYQYLA